MQTIHWSRFLICFENIVWKIQKQQHSMQGKRDRIQLILGLMLLDPTLQDSRQLKTSFHWRIQKNFPLLLYMKHCLYYLGFQPLVSPKTWKPKNICAFKRIRGSSQELSLWSTHLCFYSFQEEDFTARKENTFESLLSSSQKGSKSKCAISFQLNANRSKSKNC